MKRIRMLVGFVFLLATLFGVMSSQALAMLSFDLNAGNSAIASYPGPYLHVGVTWIDSTHATFDVTSYLITQSPPSANNYYFGGNHGFAVNVNGPVTYSDIIVTLSNGAAGSYATTGSPGTVDGFGSFNQGVGFDGNLHNVKELQFQLTTTGSWANESSILTPNASGYLAAAEIYPFDANGNALATGFAGGDGTSSTSPVPIPAAVWLLGTGLVGLVGIRRRFQK